jgi:hypothetical protein
MVADRSAQAAVGIWPALNARLADDAGYGSNRLSRW